jgi:hypothetical protein
MYTNNDYLEYGYTKKGKPTEIWLERALEEYNYSRSMGKFEVMEAKISRMCEILECILNTLPQETAQTILDNVLMGGNYKIGDVPDELN